MREQFNLENFLAGKYERVETRIKQEVTNLEYKSKFTMKPLVGLMGGDEVTWNNTGNYRIGPIESAFDLFGILKQQS